MNFTPAKMLGSVKIYWDSAAREVDPGTHRPHGIKSVHDSLHQMAIDLNLARAVVYISPQKPDRLQERSQLLAKRPVWYPANRTIKMRRDLMWIDVGGFDKSWLQLKLLAEPPTVGISIWERDPALILEPNPGVFYCRSASVGHEGHVFYFVYARESTWEARLTSTGLALFGSGEAAYRRLVPEPGAIAGSQKTS